MTCKGSGMLHIEIRPFLDNHPPPLLLKNAARLTLRARAVSHSDLSIVLTDDEEICALNRDFRGVDAPTDVLAFPADETDPQTNRRYLGDIVISWPRAREQAVARGHSPEAEAQLLVVHGVLHLLGFDHEEPEAKARMWALQEEILARLGLAGLAMT